MPRRAAEANARRRKVMTGKVGAARHPANGLDAGNQIEIAGRDRREQGRGKR